MTAHSGRRRRTCTATSHEYTARKIVVATGYYDRPNYMGIPGEDLPKVMHYYKDPHPYFDMDVLVIGAKNSASIAALELWRRGSRVTMVHRGPDIHRNVKYWIKPDIENRIKNGEVTAYFNSCVLEIRPEAVRLKTPEGERVLKNDFVFALTGYHPDYEFLESLGIELTRPEMKPVCDPRRLRAMCREFMWPGAWCLAQGRAKFLLRMDAFTASRLPTT